MYDSLEQKYFTVNKFTRKQSRQALIPHIQIYELFSYAPEPCVRGRGRRDLRPQLVVVAQEAQGERQAGG